MNILISGANGQIGTELTMHLFQRYGKDSVFPTDVREGGDGFVSDYLDITSRDALYEYIRTHNITRIYHLAAILSGNGEKNPLTAYHVNMEGTLNVLEACREFSLERVFSPSSIAVYGGDAPRQNTPEDSILKPETMYGITKVSSELLFDYYHRRYGCDVRSLRFPGVISYKAEPGGGSTDFAVDIFRQAVDQGHYSCFVREDSRLPFMYMPDVIASIDGLMDAPQGSLRRRTYNVTGFSASAGDFAREVSSLVPGFSIEYAPDFRQAIVDQWPESIDDGPARNDWGWKAEYDLTSLGKDMIQHLKSSSAGGNPNGNSGGHVKEAS
ncbi:NAD-dependent epimerase/dehydratase family protein [Salinispira pacifica]|uniref:L-threonine 3-dehydrogenase n=1 Tax=Salinispira pacifica TaxID=1307761 RepID=V5WF77_9SPIO|nr:NAD-dependent epimerase/dehydratase family protein [Salinispira pacifica]AHC14290.1 L-threonine 3-dehydrogenase [Salinispira pacifica]